MTETVLRRSPGGIPVVLAGLGLAALVAVIYFDLGTSLPLNDEFFYRWTAAGLATGHGFRMWPSALPPALPQMGAAALVRLVAADPRWMRLSVLPFMLLQAVFSYRLAARLGADRAWSAIAAAALGLHPVYLSVATGLMSDPAYLALLTTAAWFGVTWIEEGRNRWFAVATATAAVLERQHGLGVMIAIGAALLLSRRRRPLLRADVVVLASMVAASLLALESPFWFGFASDHLRRLHGLSSLLPTAGNAVGTVVEAPIMAGLLLLPFAVGLWRRPTEERRRVGRLELIPVALATVAVLGAAMFAVYFGTMIYPGDQFGPWGMGPLHLGGSKPALVPTPVFLAIEVASTASALVILGRRARMWVPGALAPAEAFLVLLALSQLLPMLNTSSTDRYHLAVAAPLVPLLAARASAGAVRAGAIAAVLVMAVGVAYFAVAEQDYQAWQQARDIAARQAFGRYGVEHVAAGYEAAGLYLALPVVDRTGHLPSGIDPDTMQPLAPRARLVFAPPDDPRHGAGYDSLAPGRVVAQEVP